jgi:hypothetical protein
VEAAGSLVGCRAPPKAGSTAPDRNASSDLCDGLGRSYAGDVTDEWIVPPPPTFVEPSAPFVGLDATVVDFWSFALGDLRMNNARGYLTEFIVARLLGIENPHRIEWAEHDVEFEGLTIEVKSSAYLQSWDQRRLSSINFTGLTGTRYTPRTGYDSGGRQFNAMVYVFCVQSAQLHLDYDALDVRQWQFYVLPRQVLVDRGAASISLAALSALTGPVRAEQLRAAVLEAGRT